MSRICWWAVDVLSRTLESEEREAVRGDFAELNETAGRALRDLLGLVVRRQAALWLDWRPWLALLSIVVPLGMLLSVVSRYWADGSAVHWWFYVNHWTSGYVESPGARSDLAAFITGLLRQYLTLICWSWTVGFVVGSLSRRTIGINGALLCLVLFVGTLGSTSTGRANPANAPVFSLAFYRVLYPLILRLVLVVVPALRGMHKGIRLGSLPLLQTARWVLLVAIVTTLAARGLEYSVIFGWLGPWRLPRLLYPGPDGFVVSADDVLDWRVRLLPYALMWPVGYMLAIASWRRRPNGRDNRRSR